MFMGNWQCSDNVVFFQAYLNWPDKVWWEFKSPIRHGKCLTIQSPSLSPLSSHCNFPLVEVAHFFAVSTRK